MHAGALELQDLMTFLFAAGIVVPLARRLRISPALGFLVIGVLIGPHGLARFVGDAPWLAYATIENIEGVHALAELGVVFLLFMIGLELSLERLWQMRRAVFGMGGAQVLTSGVVIAGLAAAFGNDLRTAIVLGCGFALSSTAIVMQILTEGRRIASPTGRASFAVLLFQDLAVLPILFLVAAFGGGGETSPFVAFASAMGQALAAVAIILVAGRLVIRPLFRLIGVAASREMFLAFVLLVVIGTALATETAGLSMALGAFIAGLLFAETEHRYAIEADIEPFKGLLLGVFFVSVGMTVDLGQVAAKPYWLAAAVVGLFLVKAPILYGLARLFGESRAVAAEAALLLGQGGEFAFVVVGLAVGVGLLPRETAQFMLLTTSLTMIATPFVAVGARRLARVIERREAGGAAPQRRATAELAGHVIVAGYGRVGRLLSDVLDEQRFDWIAIDADPKLVARYRARDSAVYFGDAAREEIMRRCSPESAAALVVTMDDPAAAERVVRAARRNWPNLVVYARAADNAHAARLLAAGARHVVPEALEASLQLGERLLLGIGVPEGAVLQQIEARRQAELAELESRRGG